MQRWKEIQEWETGLFSLPQPTTPLDIEWAINNISPGLSSLAWNWTLVVESKVKIMTWQVETCTRLSRVKEIIDQQSVSNVSVGTRLET